MSSRSLTGKQRRHLRALGHHLSPIVLVGKDGVTAGVGAELDRALLDHELVKVRLQEACPAERDEVATALTAATRSEVAGEMGRTLLLYRAHPEKPRIVLPTSKK